MRAAPSRHVPVLMRAVRICLSSRLGANTPTPPLVWLVVTTPIPLDFFGIGIMTPSPPASSWPLHSFMDVLESSAYLQQAAVQGRTAHASAGMAANNAYLRHHQPVPHISHTQHVTHTMPHTQQGGVEGPGSGSGGQAAGPKSPAKGGPIPPRNL